MSSDITKCSGQDCPIKEKCYRFIVKSNEFRQSYFTEIPGKWGWRREKFKNGEIFDHREFQCEMFWGEQNQKIMNQLKEIMK